MNILKETVLATMKAISDQGNVYLSKFISYFGWTAGIGGGTVQAAPIVSSKIAENPIIQECAKVAPAWLMYVPVVAAASLVFKNLSDHYYNGKRLELEKAKNDKPSPQENP